MQAFWSKEKHPRAPDQKIRTLTAAGGRRKHAGLVRVFFLWGHEASATPSLQIFTTPLLRSSPEFDLQRGLPRRGLLGERKAPTSAGSKNTHSCSCGGARGLAGGESTLDFFVSLFLGEHEMSGTRSLQLFTTSFHMQAQNSIFKGDPPRGAFLGKRKTPTSADSKIPVLARAGRGAAPRGPAGGRSPLDFFVSLFLGEHEMSGTGSLQIFTTSFHTQAQNSIFKGDSPRGAFLGKRKTPTSADSKNTHSCARGAGCCPKGAGGRRKPAGLFRVFVPR